MPHAVHYLQKKADDLTEQNAVLSAEKDSLSLVLASCDDKKDTEILRLRMCVTAHQKNKETSDVLCQSLIDETMELKQKLQMTGEMCHQMARSLHVEGRGAGATPRKQVTTADSYIQVPEVAPSNPTPSVSVTELQGHVTSSTPSPQSPKMFLNGDTFKSQLSSSSSGSNDSVQLVILNQKVIFLEEENKKYKEKLEKVIEHNNHWQKYDSERDQYVKTLQEKLTALQTQLDVANKTNKSSDVCSEQQQREVDQLLLAAKQKQETMEHQREQLEDEFRKYQVELQNAQDCIMALEAELIEVKSRPQTGQQNQEYIDKIQMLEAQVQIFSEDFKSERRDRERVQAKCSHLEGELDLYKRQLDSFQTKACYNSAMERQRMMAMYEQEHEEKKRLGLTQRTAVARGVTMQPEQGTYMKQGMSAYPVYGMDTRELEEDGDDVIDSLPEPTEREPTDEVMLECPKCNAGFPISRHEELLEHIDVCNA